MSVADLEAIKDELRRQVAAQLAADGYQAERTAFLWEADLRHEGQATELTVPFEGEDFAQIRERFVAEYFKTYGYRDVDPDRTDEGARRRARPARQPPGLRQHEDRRAAGRVAIRHARRCPSRAASAAVAVEIVDRSALGASPRQGPLIIEEFDATIVVPPDATGAQAMRSAASCWSSRHEGRSDHLCGHQERTGFDRRRHGLHGGPHRALRDRQGRDGFLRGALRRRRPDGGAGQDHRPASRRDPGSHGLGAGEIRRRSA